MILMHAYTYSGLGQTTNLMSTDRGKERNIIMVCRRLCRSMTHQSIRVIILIIGVILAGKMGGGGGGSHIEFAFDTTRTRRMQTHTILHGPWCVHI